MMGLLDSWREKISGIVPRRHYAIDGTEPIENGRYVVLDTELTGLELHQDSIVSVGALRMNGSRIDLGDAFYRVLNPSTAMRPDSVVVHEITPSEVTGKPTIEEALIELVGYCRDDIIVGHFVSLDMDFINKDMRRMYETNMKNHVIDTCSIHEWMRNHDGDFRRHFGGFSDELNLVALAKKYRIPVAGAHNALSDAFMTAQLFQRFLNFLPGMGVRTVRDLLRIGKA